MEFIPLTLPQQDIYYDQLIAPNASFYNIGAKVEISGPVDLVAFKKAYAAFVEQHDVLSYVLSKKENDVFFIKRNTTETTLDYIDFSDKSNPEKEAHDYIKNDFKIPFDLFFSTTLFNFRLLKINKNSFILYSKYHHIITDGWGTSVLFQRLVTYYNEYLECQSIQSKFSYEYVDFVKNDIAYQNSKALFEDKTYWISKYKNLPEPLFSINKEPNKEPKSKRKIHYIARNKYNQLIELSKQLRASSFHVILGILYTYFGRFNNNQDFAIGLPVLNRNKADFKKTVGLFMGMTALRMKLGLDSTFDALVAEIRGQLRKDYRHQRFPLGKLIQELSAFKERDKIFNITLSYEKHNYADTFKNTTTNVIPLTHGSERVALAIFIREFDDNEDVKIDFDYNLEYFDEKSIAQFTLHFQKLIDEVLKYPNRKLYELDYMTSHEKEIILQKFNNTQKDYPDATVHELIDKQTSLFPDKIALKDDIQAYTYHDIQRLSDQISSQLMHMDSNTSRSPIAVILDRSADMVVLLLGVMKSGRPYIPLDPSFPSGRLQYILKHAKTKTMVCGNTCADKLIADSDVTILNKDQLFQRAKKSKIASASKPTFSSSTTAYIIYTSGSTGNPKGVEISHRSVVNFLTSMQSKPGITDSDLLFSVTTPSFDIAVLEFFLPLITGGTVFMADHTLLEDPKKIIKRINDIEPSIIQATPSFYQILYSSGWVPNSNLKLLCGGDLLSQDLAHKMITTTKEVWNMYGPTETTIWSSVKRIFNPEDAKNIGSPIHNTSIYILDDWLQPAAIGQLGNIYIGGDGLAKGYYLNSALTKERFIKSPFGHDQLIYNTGDVGKWLANGEIEFLGRSDNQVKIRGYRIELGEIEKVLVSLPFLKAAVTIAKKGAKQDAFLVSFIVFEEAFADTTHIISELKKKLPSYMIPQVIIPLEAFPLTPNKKVDRKKLAEKDISKYFTKETPTQKPIGSIEHKLSQLWKKVLNTEVVDISSNFFALGGHSIKAVELSELINVHFNTDIGIKTVFDYPTIKEQAAFLETFEKKNPVSIPKAKEANLYDLAPAQKGLWLACQQHELSATYNMFAAFEIKGNIDIPKLQSAMQQLINSHEILRTNFVEHLGTPKLKINPASKRIFNLSTISIAQNENFETAISELGAPSFDLENDLLFRSYLVHHIDKSQYLVFVTHHLIMDGHSLEIFKRQLARTYNNAKNEVGIRQYKDYADWSHVNQENSANIKKSKAFWRNVLHEYLPKSTFKKDREIPSFKGAVERFELREKTYSNITNVATASKISKFSVILASIQTFVYRVTGNNDFAIGIPISGRVHSDLKNMMGMFVNTVPIRYTQGTHNDKNFLSNCLTTNNYIINAIAHQEYNFQNVLKDLGFSNALFDIVVAYQNPDYELQNITNFNGFSLEQLPLKQHPSRFPITFNFFEKEDSILCELAYDIGLFDNDTIILLMQKYQKFLSEVTQKTHVSIDNIDLELDIEKELKITAINIDINF